MEIYGVFFKCHPDAIFIWNIMDVQLICKSVLNCWQVNNYIINNTVLLIIVIHHTCVLHETQLANGLYVGK